MVGPITCEEICKPCADKVRYKGKCMKLRHFNVLAISTKIVYNKHGDHDPNGLLYVLKENEDILKEEVKKNPFTPVDIVQPLVIRANLGDILIINFENKLDIPASIHIQDVKYNVLNSDGASIGFNPDTTTCSKIRYKWFADKEGIFMFHDMSDPRSTEDATNVHGLFGALIVEPVGATWTDPVTGKLIRSGLYVDIHHPSLPDFREYVTIFHDEPEIKDSNGNPPMSHTTGMPESTMPINYRAEPMRNRHPDGTGGVGEEVSLSSWPFGDPATPVLRTYKGDPAKIRVIHSGIMETHVFHLHNHQWKLEPNDPKSTIIDSISFSPQQCITIEPLFGAGSLNGCIGDVIWHCHLYPHFAEGMWGLWRILDRLEDGTKVLPDGSCVPALIPLPDRIPPLPPDNEHPGFPRFIAGEVGKKAFKPPLGIVGGRGPTELEEANFVPNAEPGALYSNPCPKDAVTKVFEVVAIQVPIKYNKEGWHDPEGRIFVLKDDYDAVRCFEKEPEPFVIRANVGDCIKIRLTNKLPKTIGGNAFQLKTEPTEAGFHIHLVKFDTIVADGSANGWCNDASADIGDTLIERFYADTELRTIFFHDHLFPNANQQHGLFGALIIEPHNSTYHNPETGNEIKSGTKSIIKRPGEPDFREFVLAVHDFALLFDKEKNPLNPPPFPGSQDDPGVMGINYKSEPLQFRIGDPTYVFSSFVHGDPVTPLLETYERDPIRIRLFDGAHEEQHSFNLHGLRWRKEPTDLASPLIQSQTLGISEAFNIEIDEHPEVPVDAPFPPSNRVSIHVQLLKYDVLASDGATVGFNYDQSIAPCESITYRWFADSELGTCMLTGFGDIRNHRHHGLFGAIIIEPTGSKYIHPQTGDEVKDGYLEDIVISNPGMPDFREFVVFMQDGLSLYDKHDNPIPDPVDAGHDMARLDFEDQGQKGINYS